MFTSSRPYRSLSICRTKRRSHQLPGFVDIDLWADSSLCPNSALHSHTRRILPALQCRRSCGYSWGWQVTCIPLSPAAISLHGAGEFDVKCLAYCACHGCNDCRHKPLSLSLIPEHWLLQKLPEALREASSLLHYSSYLKARFPLAFSAR